VNAQEANCTLIGVDDRPPSGVRVWMAMPSALVISPAVGEASIDS
jgi:hypothetical protein